MCKTQTLRYLAYLSILTLTLLSVFILANPVAAQPNIPNNFFPNMEGMRGSRTQEHNPLKQTFIDSTRWQPQWGVVVCHDAFGRGFRSSVHKNLSIGCQGRSFHDYVHEMLRRSQEPSRHILINSIKVDGRNIYITFEFAR